MTDPQVILNLGTGGSDLNGQNGSTSGADSNDARLLVWPGDNAGNYLHLPGVNGNGLSVPDEAALDITGDIDLRGWVASDAWSTGQGRIIHKGLQTAEIAYVLFVTTSGTVRLQWTEDGSTLLTRTSTVAVPFADGEAGWVRATLDVDDGSSNHVATFYTSTDGITWSALGAPVTTAGVTSIYSSAQPLYVGGRALASFPFGGNIYRAQVLDGIDGTLVLDVDTSVISSGSATSFTALTGQTVSINRSTSGRKSVAVVSPVWLFGTDDFMEVADNALLDFGASDDFTVLAIVRQWNTPLNTGTYVNKREASAGYWLIARQTSLRPQVFVSDGTNTATPFPSTTVTEGSLQVYGGVVDRSAQTVAPIMDGVVDATADISSVGSLENALPFLLGRRSGGTPNYQDFELIGVAVYRRALTQAEIAQVTAYYQARLS
jgi:hypothetical protein